MKPLSIRLSSLLCALLFAAAISFTSCGPDDKCHVDLSCKNGGTCMENSCLCPTAFDGIDCSHDISTKFIGNWEQNGNSISGEKFPVSVVRGDHTGQVAIKNFDNRTANTVFGIMMAKDTVSLSSESVKGTLVYTDGSKMLIYYDITDSAGNVKHVNTTIGK